MLTQERTTILIGGKAGAGKSTSATHIAKSLVDSGLSISVTPFAKYLKEVAQLVGWDGQKDGRGRTLLQELGQIVRRYDEDYWVRYALQTIIDKELHVAIVDDWRFPNEERYLRENPMSGRVVTIYLNNKDRILTGEQGKEVSENSLLDRPPDYDYYIDNSDGDLPHLYEELTIIIRDLFGLNAGAKSNKLQMGF